MDTNKKYFARIIFKTKVYESDYSAFEDLFCKVMELGSSSFNKVKPQGRYGDRKNDGFDSDTNTFYQVYAPENLVSKERNAIKKLNEDFEGLKDHWRKNGFQIDKYYFVVNDKFKGSYPTLYAAIRDLNNKNKDIAIELFRAKHLDDTFLTLSEVDMSSVLGGIIPNSNDIGDIDYGILNEVIEFILHYDIQDVDKMIPTDPNFENKIMFNSISECLASFLRVGSQQTYVIHDFFERNSNFAKEKLRNNFQSLYKEGLDLYRDNTNASDLVFSYIWKKSVPKSKKVYYDAVCVLMAHYFEFCDIFEPLE